MMRIGIIGGGRVGSCLAEYLREQEALVGITTASAAHASSLARSLALPLYTNAELVARSELVLLTVPDRLIARVAEELATTADVQGKLFLHCSGSLGLDVLASLSERGARRGSLHPLQSFAGGRVNLQGVYMAVDGDLSAREAARSLAELLGGHPFYVPAEERAAYHAAACICSNYVVTVEALAQNLMSRWLGDADAAWQALLPLFNGTATNLQGARLPQNVLTGPIGRGDTDTVRKHLAVLPPELREVYCSLGLATTGLALTNGTIDKSTALALLRLLKR